MITSIIEERTVAIPEGGCVVWMGELNRNGYGRVWVGGKRLMAHRVNYELKVGQVPDGLVLDHLCRNRCCVNPHHLEPVTHQENTRRGEVVLFSKGEVK